MRLLSNWILLSVSQDLLPESKTMCERMDIPKRRGGGGSFYLATRKNYILCPFRTFDDCFNATCEQGATCVDGISNFTCSCQAGYTGTLCQIGKRNT